MIHRGARNVAGQELEGCHGGQGSYWVRTLLDGEFASSLRYVRDLVLHAHSTIGEHPHQGNEELYFCISGKGTIVVDGEEERFCPGDIVLTKSGSTHALRNDGERELRILVVHAAVVGP